MNSAEGLHYLIKSDYPVLGTLVHLMADVLMQKQNVTVKKVSDFGILLIVFVHLHGFIHGWRHSKLHVHEYIDTKYTIFVM